MNKLLTGLAVGVVLGILFAPDKGSATRQKIADQGRDIKDKFNDLVDDLMHKFDETIDDVTENAEEFADKAKATMASKG